MIYAQTDLRLDTTFVDYVFVAFSFILGLFWKRMTGPAGWTGPVSGTIAAVTVDVLVRVGVLALSSQAGSYVGASAAFVVGIVVAVAVSTFTRPKPHAEPVGLVWSLTSKEERSHSTTGDDGGWYRSPALLGGIVPVMTAGLYLLVPEEGPDDGEEPPTTEARSAAGSITALFGVYGVILTVLGLFGDNPEQLAEAGGVEINLWTGIGMLVVAGIFVTWQRLRPTITG